MVNLRFSNSLTLEHIKNKGIKNLFRKLGFIKWLFKCSKINKSKNLKLTILRFWPSPGSYLYYSIVVKTFFIVKTSFIIHKFTWIHLNSHNFYTYIPKCIFWGSNYFGVYGSWLVWLLLYVFMVADLLDSLILSRTESKK